MAVDVRCAPQLQSCLEFEDGRGQLACIRSRIWTMSSVPNVPSNSVGISGPMVVVPVRRAEYHTAPSIANEWPETQRRGNDDERLAPARASPDALP